MKKRSRYALLSVADRTGITEFAYALHGLGFKLVAAGGTAKALRQAELEILDASELADGTEGSVALLHPAVLGGVTLDRDESVLKHVAILIALPPRID